MEMYGVYRVHGGEYIIAWRAHQSSVTAQHAAYTSASLAATTVLSCLTSCTTLASPLHLSLESVPSTAATYTVQGGFLVVKFIAFPAIRPFPWFGQDMSLLKI